MHGDVCILGPKNLLQCHNGKLHGFHFENYRNMHQLGDFKRDCRTIFRISWEIQLFVKKMENLPVKENLGFISLRLESALKNVKGETIIIIEFRLSST